MELDEQKRYWQVYTDCWHFMRDHLARSDELQKSVSKDTEAIFKKHGNSRFVNQMVNAMRKELDDTLNNGTKDKVETYRKMYADAWLFFRKYSDIKAGAEYERWQAIADESDTLVNETYRSISKLACDTMLASINEIENVSRGCPWREETMPQVDTS